MKSNWSGLGNKIKEIGENTCSLLFHHGAKVCISEAKKGNNGDMSQVERPNSDIEACPNTDLISDLYKIPRNLGNQTPPLRFCGAENQPMVGWLEWQ
jgi:hypothetical protein